ncbi:hypothetical protein R1sor_000237 [Riccia sorocarpa]|uniref:Myb/SANT-like DNA-binding domain-containing protein n=1 Tax=Riccia sorocarpa TaxID=122646 RepID=A0ABD3GSJ4_9MARC
MNEDDGAHRSYQHGFYVAELLHDTEDDKIEVEDSGEEDDDNQGNLDDDEDQEDEEAQERHEHRQDFHTEQKDAKAELAIVNLRSNNSTPGAGVMELDGPGYARSNGVIEATAGGGAETRRENINAGGGSGGRDDWTESATHVLLEVWGERYISLNKGNLKQEDWEEVAEVVSSVSKTHKTDVQCKNRLDTLKKKYKVERHKQSVIGSSDSKWPFYKRLDQLLSATFKRAEIPNGIDAGVPVKSSVDREDSNRLLKEDEDDLTTGSSSSSSKDSAEMTYSSTHDARDATGGGTHTSRKRKSVDSSFKTLAKAITRFGEIYEKIEQSKQQQLMDLEKIRMEFTRDLELQRMQLFMQTQVELAKMKNTASEADPTVSNLSQVSQAPLHSDSSFCGYQDLLIHQETGGNISVQEFRRDIVMGQRSIRPTLIAAFWLEHEATGLGFQLRGFAILDTQGLKEHRVCALGKLGPKDATQANRRRSSVRSIPLGVAVDITVTAVPFFEVFRFGEDCFAGNCTYERGGLI